MNDFVLPYGNHYGTAQEIMGQLPTAPAPAADPSGMMYGLPPVGSPESEQLVQMLGSSAGTTLAPEEMEQLKWQNWAQAQRFESLGPAAQRELATLYADNVLPYVASSMGAPAEQLQQEFMVNYPEVGVLLGRELTDVDRRAINIEQYGEGLTPEQERHILFTGNMPSANQQDPGAKLQSEWQARAGIVDQMRNSGQLEGVDPDDVETFILTGDRAALTGRGAAAGRPTMVEQMNERRQMIQLAGGEERFTPDQIAAFELTGNASLLSPSATATAREEHNRVLSENENFLRVAETQLVPVDAALTNIGRAFEVLGVDDDFQVQDEAFRIPRSGPMATAISDSKLLSTLVSSEPARLRGLMESVEAAAAFDALKRLREASVDGSSGLGQVTEREIALLISEHNPLNTRYLDDQQLADSLYAMSMQMALVRRLIQRDIDERRAMIEGLESSEAETSEPPAGDAPVDNVPEGIDPEDWRYLTDEERAAWQ